MRTLLIGAATMTAIAAAVLAVQPIGSDYKVATTLPTSLPAVEAELKALSVELNRLSKLWQAVGPVDANAREAIVRDSDGEATMCKTKADQRGEMDRIQAIMAPLSQRQTRLAQLRHVLQKSVSQPAK